MVLSEDTCVQNVEKKEDNLVSSSEENEWDKLLRVRWEKYQSEEEAALGRGKRQRKAISYREAYASHPNETLSEGAVEEEREPVPVPEPERGYSQAGRALKEKYAKLRAKQKERLARRNEIEASGPMEGQAGRESPCHLLPPQAHFVNLMNLPSQHREEKHVAMNLDNNSRLKSSETERNMGDSTLRLGKLKHKLNNGIDLPSRGHPLADIPQSSKHAQDMSYINSVNKQLLPPVLGLCAPNAHQAEAPQRNLSRSNIRQHRQGLGLDFPTIAPPHELSTEMVAKVLPRRFRLPDLPVDPQQQPPKNSLPDFYLPLNPHHRPVMRERGSAGYLKKSGATLSDTQERTALPKPFDKPLLPRYPFPAMNMPRPPSGLFPSLSLGSRVADVNESVREHPVLPFLPNLKFPPHDASRFNPQEQEMPPSRGLGHMAPSSSSFPENHWKVLENIMLRTGLGSGSGSGSGNLLKRRNKLDVWCEDELDCLWIGVRRHGRGNWDAMLRDTKLKFSKYRTPEDLSIRWDEEQLKIMDGPALPAPKPSKPTKVGKSGLFSGISDEMMARALHGSKLNEHLLPTHLTDMKLGFGNLPSSFPHLEPPERLGLNSKHISHLPTPSADKYRVGIPRDLNAGPSDRAGAPSSFLTESPFLLNSSGSSSLGPLGLGCHNRFDSQKENDDGASRSVKLPSLLDRPLNISHDSHNNVGGRESSNYPPFPVVNKGQKVSQSKGKEVAECSPPKNKLPHWLREAVSTPAKLTEPDLPPTVSAIAQSVRVLYGEEKPPSIPPFVIPSPPPSQPRVPWLSLRKKKKKKQQQQHGLQAVGQFPIDFAGTVEQGCSLHGEGMAGASSHQDPAFPLLSRVMGMTSGLTSNEANLNMPSLSVNVNPSTSTFPLTKTSTGLSPSPEVLQLVASCVAPGPPIATSSSFPENMTPLPKSVDLVASSDSQGSHEKQETDQTSAPATWVPFQAEKEVETDSRDSSKTQSDSAQARQEDAEAMSSEGTVSDHQKDDHEP